MTFPRVKPSGWAVNEVLTSAQMNQADINISNATDSRHNSDELPALAMIESAQVFGNTAFGVAAGHCWHYDLFEDEYAFTGEIATDLHQALGTPNRLQQNFPISVTTASNIVGNNCKVGLNAIVVPQRDTLTPAMVRKIGANGAYVAVTTQPTALDQSIAYAATTNIFTTLTGIGGGAGVGWKSTDDGDNWSTSTGSPGLTTTAINPVLEGATGSDSNGTRMMFLFRITPTPPQDVEVTYTDDGDNWTQVIITGSQHASGTAAICHNANTGSWIVATKPTTSLIEFWRSTDGGATWSSIGTYNFSMSAGDPYMMRTLGKGVALIISDISASSHGILYSGDDGLNWKLLGKLEATNQPHLSYMGILHDPILNMPNQIIVAASPSATGSTYSLRTF